jgi:uridylate kinase
VGGLGNPLFTTDSTASVRAVELNSNIMLKATNVDGVFSTDPKIDANAKKYKSLTFNEAINKNLKVMDQTSLCFCRDYGLNVRVFDANKKNALISAINGDEIGTLVHD